MKQTYKTNHRKSLVKEILSPATTTKASSILKADSTEPVSAFTHFIITRIAELVPKGMELLCMEVIKIERSQLAFTEDNRLTVLCLVLFDTEGNIWHDQTLKGYF